MRFLAKWFVLGAVIYWGVIYRWEMLSVLWPTVAIATSAGCTTEPPLLIRNGSGSRTSTGSSGRGAKA